jgi:hypothetical protein
VTMNRYDKAFKEDAGGWSDETRSKKAAEQLGEGYYTFLPDVLSICLIGNEASETLPSYCIYTYNKILTQCRIYTWVRTTN